MFTLFTDAPKFLLIGSQFAKSPPAPDISTISFQVTNINIQNKE